VLDSFDIDRGGRLFRPPFGKLNLVGLFYVWWEQRRVAFWNVDPKDFRCRTGAEVASFVFDHLAPGAVILLHDGPTNLETETGIPVVVTAVKRILEEARERKLNFAPLGAMLASGRVKKGTESSCPGAQADSSQEGS
jgi:peptidoglycan/xylan/chitin deacetylase (PgdA/CDA1 family)